MKSNFEYVFFQKCITDFCVRRAGLASIFVEGL